MKTKHIKSLFLAGAILAAMWQTASSRQSSSSNKSIKIYPNSASGTEDACTNEKYVDYNSGLFGNRSYNSKYSAFAVYPAANATDSVMRKKAAVINNPLSVTALLVK